MRHTLNSLTALFFLLLVLSCAKPVNDPVIPPTIPPVEVANPSIRGYTTTTPTLTVQLAPNAVLVQKSLNDKLVEKTSTTIKYLTTTESSTIVAGDVLYSKPTDKAPDGYAVMVTKKTVQGDKIIFDTRPATISEVFVKLKEVQAYVPNLKLEPPIFYDPMSPAAQGGRQRAGEIPLLNPKRFKNLKITEESFNVDYIFFDGDNNLDTENDQFLFGIKFDHTLTNMTVEYDGAMKIYGEHKYAVAPNISYTYNADKISSDFVKSTVENFKRNLIGKKILIGTVPLPANPAMMLVAKPSLDMYMTFELEGSGKFKVVYSYENFGYTFNYNSAKKTENSLVPLSTAKGVAGFEIEFEGKAKLAFGGGAFLKFPLFEYKPGEPSYLGLTTEFGIGAEFNFTGGLYTSGGLKCKKLAIKPVATRESYLEANIGLVGKPTVEEKYKINSATPQRLADVDWNVCGPDDAPVGPFDIKTGLLAYYSFNGHSKDSTANAFHAVAINGPVLTTDRNGRANSAYAFSRAQKSAFKVTTSKAATVKYSDTTHVLNQIKDKLTLAAWVYTNKGIVDHPIISKKGSLVDIPQGVIYYYDDHFNFKMLSSFYAGVDRSYVSLYSINVACARETTVPLQNKNLEYEFPQERWMHVVAVHDGNVIRHYLNGVLVGEVTNVNCYRHPKLGHFSPLYIGSETIGSWDGKNESGRYGTDGKIDEVYIFKRALTANDVKALYLSKN